MFTEKDSRLIEMELHRLDMIASATEAKFGIGNLPEWMPDDFKAKWQTQLEKLDDAVRRDNYPEVRQLVDGCLRAWKMMEDNAVRLGKGQDDVEWFECRLDCGFTIRIAKNASEARRITQDGVYVWSLDEVARVIKSEHTLVNQVKSVLPEAKVASVEPFDFEKGDEIPI